MKALVYATVGLVALAVGTGQAQAPELQVGDQAPAFSLPGTDGRTHNVAQYKGKWVVVAWFPKAFTAG